MSLAGPVSNLIVATILGIVLRVALYVLPAVIDLPSSIISIISVLLTLLNAIVLTNIVIALFNLLPLPPLDGHGVLLGLLSLSKSTWAYRVSNVIVSMERQGPLYLLLLIIATQVLGLNLLGWLLGPPMTFFYHLIVGA